MLLYNFFAIVTYILIGFIRQKVLFYKSNKLSKKITPTHKYGTDKIIKQIFLAHKYGSDKRRKNRKKTSVLK